jgi:hypothetical protein
MRFTARRWARGQIFILMAISMAVLAAFAALAIDVGNLWTTKRLMQTAADAAAIAGANAVLHGAGTGSSTITSAANNAATLDGYTDGSSTLRSSRPVSVVVNNPPASGPYAGNSDAVQVTISQTQPTYFMPVAGITSVPISVTAQAMIKPSGNCIYALDPSASGALTVSGTSTLSSTCGAYVNSSSSTALTINGGGTLEANPVGVVGGFVVNGNAPTPPVSGIAPFTNPFATVGTPTVGKCTGFKGTSVTNGQTVTFDPGTYCGGIKITGGTVTFNPGVYVIDGGGLSFSGATISGTGVTFFLTGSGNGSSPSAYGGVTITSTATVNLSAPTSGPYEAILFYQDPSVTSTASNGSSIVGSANSTFDGALYFPTTALTYAGNSSSNGYTMLVADTIKVTGNSYVGTNYSSLADGDPIKSTVLSY